MGIDAPLLGAGDVTEAQARSAGATITDLAALQHDCELSKKGNVTVCRHPDHGIAHGSAKLAMQVLGLIPDEPSGRRSRLGAAVPVKVRCPVCGRLARLRGDNKIGHHAGADDKACEGRGHPVENANEAAS